LKYMAHAENITGETGAIILAAGESKRLGRPKQIVRFAGQTLLEQTVTTALASRIDTAIVVLGANSSTCEQSLRTYPVQIVVNESWWEGISSSIKAGLKSLESHAESVFDSVLFLTCDQPFLTVNLINDLLAEFRTNGPQIVASSYASCIGIPALFSSDLFPELGNLQGDSGASSIIKTYLEKDSGRISTVSFPSGEIDIDTNADIERLALLIQDSVAQADTK
jgi:molybdenum cofactor cytidylyltransferase